MKKTEIANSLGVTSNTINWWADQFVDWFDVDSRWVEKEHDENDIQLFALIDYLNKQVGNEVSTFERRSLIERGLRISEMAYAIRQRRDSEKSKPEVQRWSVISSLGISLKHDYEWLEPLKPHTSSIATFGCWTSDTVTGTCSEPYALLWSLDASRVVVVDKNPEYTQNAKHWLRSTREKYPYFNDYNLEFIQGDMTDKDLLKRVDALKEDYFELSYCCDVLYNMHPDSYKLSLAIETMARVVKLSGWIIAVEPKMGVKFEMKPCEIFNGKLSIPVPLSEPIDISCCFEAIGLRKFSLDGAPEYSCCYQK
jgi:hypothetical protein